MNNATRTIVAAACALTLAAAASVGAQQSGDMKKDKADDGKMMAQDAMKKDMPMDQSMGDMGMMGMTAYEVTITNVTDGQPLSPPLLATHAASMHAWKEGEKASKEVEMIAEGGKNKAMAKMLEESKASDVVAGGMADHIMPGQSKTFTVMAKPGDVLTVLTMLAATNDGFTGVSDMKLGEGEPASRDLMAYDAGTEQNTEMKADVPAPAMGMGHPATTPPEAIKMHTGLTGKGDLDKMKMGWVGPVARISVTKKMMDKMDKTMDNEGKMK